MLHFLGALHVIEKLGYIQVDTLAVVQRAHHHTLWTRCPDYKPEFLHQLQTEDKKAFEYWGHAASYLSMCDFRYYLPLKKSYYDPYGKWEKARLEKYGYMVKPVLERIRQEGPLGSKDFKSPKGTKAGNWWNWRPTKVALELLFWRGDLMIKERRNFQRIYEMADRFLSDGVDTTMPGDEEVAQFCIQRALNAHGIAS